MESLNLKKLYEQVINQEIILPTVQRGFVWKPYQIENLWDSLLRGYPIGSFVVSQKESGEKDLLDGQQRSTSICLGFYNPLEEKTEKILKSSNENIQIFIDLGKPTDSNKKYSFRVITKSHPWGYQKKDNKKRLESKDIKEFLKSQEIKKDYDYLEKPLNSFYPYDATEVLPVGLLMESALKKESFQELERKIKKWRKNKLTHESYKDEIKRKIEKLRKKESDYEIKEIYEAFQNMVEKTSIPLLELVFDMHKTDETEKSQDENKTADIQELFIRLNTEGTKLDNEEINYSILKSNISQDSQDKIEEACKGFIKPARFINITYQIFRNTKEFAAEIGEEFEGYNLIQKPREFQNQLSEFQDQSEDKKIFEDFLLKFIEEKNLEKAKELLTYKPGTNENGLPTFIANDLAQKSQEIMFMLLYRIRIKKDTFDEKNRMNVLGLITLFLWVGKEKDMGYKRLLKNIWKGVRNLDSEKFWSPEIIDRYSIQGEDEKSLKPFPPQKDLEEMIKKYKNEDKITNFKYDNEKGYYRDFYHEIFKNKDLILYTQRQAIHKWFQEIEDVSLEDHNRPFDWDHISPQKWKKNAKQEVKDWYDTNGNIRALPLGDNRSDSDNSPKDKLKGEGILEDSFCKEDWLKIDEKVDYKKNNEDAKKVIKCIIDRNLDLCLRWYTDLSIDTFAQRLKEIDEIKKQNGKDFLRKLVLNKEKWKDHPDEDIMIFLKVNEDIRLIISLFNSSELPSAQDLLLEEYIEFELRDEKDPDSEESNFFSDVDIKELEEKDKVENQGWRIYGWTNLSSYSEESQIKLFQKIYTLLKKLPKESLPIDEMLEKFKDSLNPQYRDEITKDS